MSEEDNINEKKILTSRIVFGVLMFIGECMSLLPFLKCCSTKVKSDKHKIWFSIMSCFAAGLLVSISLIHILPEANETYEKILEAQPVSEEKGPHPFPIPYFMFQLGLFIMLTVNTLSGGAGHDHNHDHHHF